MALEEVKRLVFEALGEASMCWSETPKGVFDDTKAVKVGNDLMKAIEAHKWQRSPLLDLVGLTVLSEDLRMLIGRMQKDSLSYDEHHDALREVEELECILIQCKWCIVQHMKHFTNLDVVAMSVTNP